MSIGLEAHGVEKGVGVSQAVGRQNKDEVPCEVGKLGFQSEDLSPHRTGTEFHSQLLLLPEYSM